MSRDPLASTKARKAERKADERSGLITIKPMKIGGDHPHPNIAAGPAGATTTAASSRDATVPAPATATAPAPAVPATAMMKSTGAGFKKGGFKSAFSSPLPSSSSPSSGPVTSGSTTTTITTLLPTAGGAGGSSAGDSSIQAVNGEVIIESDIHGHGHVDLGMSTTSHQIELKRRDDHHRVGGPGRGHHAAAAGDGVGISAQNFQEESDTDDEGYETYNPRYPTD